MHRDLRGTPKPDSNSVGASKMKFSGVEVGVGFTEKIFRNQIGVEIITTSNELLLFDTTITLFFILTNKKKRKAGLITYAKNEF